MSGNLIPKRRSFVAFMLVTLMFALLFVLETSIQMSRDDLTSQTSFSTYVNDSTATTEGLRKRFASITDDNDEVMMHPPPSSTFRNISRHTLTTSSLTHYDDSKPTENHEQQSSNPASIQDVQKKIILVTYFRSGSSFLGDLLQQSPSTFYSFEPLHYMTTGMRIGQDREEEAFFLLDRLLNCSFPQISFYSKWALKPDNRFLFKWNHRLWTSCSIHRAICFNPAFLKGVCLKSRNHLVKTTRMQMSQISNFINRFYPAMNSLQIVLLFRDPRGIFNSRKSLSWCSPNQNCSSPASICAEMEADIEVFEEMRSRNPSIVSLLRYEDLCLEPDLQSRKLLNWLNISYSSEVDKFIRSHTIKDPPLSMSLDNIRDPYSTRRNSRNTPFEWTTKLTMQEVAMVEESCSKVMSRLGYKKVAVTGIPILSRRHSNVVNWRRLIEESKRVRLISTTPMM